jgi:mycoredoxin-dependent peroxiredoxin
MSRFRDNSREFNETNTTIMGVSVDSTWANKAFREQVGAEFPILSDSKRDVSRAYGVLHEESGVARRTTFVIDMAGIVRHIDQDRAALDPSTALNVCRIMRK